MFTCTLLLSALMQGSEWGICSHDVYTCLSQAHGVTLSNVEISDYSDYNVHVCTRMRNRSSLEAGKLH